MPLKIRSASFGQIYIFLFLLMGVCGIGIFLIENLTSINLFQIEAEFEKQALSVAAGITGVAGLVISTMMIFLLKERRDTKPDRRQRQVAIDFPDRRSGIDRRAVQQEQT